MLKNITKKFLKNVQKSEKKSCKKLFCKEKLNLGRFYKKNDWKVWIINVTKFKKIWIKYKIMNDITCKQLGKQSMLSF